MLRIWRKGANAFEPVEPSALVLEGVVWLELIAPTRAEELAAEQALGFGLPTREDMAEIEISSRLYRRNGAMFMTALLLCTHHDEDAPLTAPVTLVLSGERLITVRYAEPKSFSLFFDQAGAQPDLCATGPQIFLGLLDAVIDRAADVLEFAAGQVEDTSRTVFREGRRGSFQPILNRLARHQMLNGKVRESLVSLARLLGYASIAPQFETDAAARGQLRLMQRDVQSLTEHSGYLGGEITFLLDAALGLINIQQNEITKIFSIAAVVFLPPTMIATVYGMNFVHMPELKWMAGYPLTLTAMLISAIVPVLWFRKKGWL